MDTTNSEPRYTLTVAITKTCDCTGKVEHEAHVKSHNLTLAETVAMQQPLLQVLQAWVSEDAP